METFGRNWSWSISAYYCDGHTRCTVKIQLYCTETPFLENVRVCADKPVLYLLMPPLDGSTVSGLTLRPVYPRRNCVIFNLQKVKLTPERV